MKDPCCAVSCIRQLPRWIKRTSGNYEIEEECRRSKDGSCPFPPITRKAKDASEAAIS